MSVARIGNFTGKPGQIDELKDFLFSIIPMIRSSPGCESVQLYQSQEDPASFTMIEIWDSVESHQASVKNIPRGETGRDPAAAGVCSAWKLL